MVVRSPGRRVSAEWIAREVRSKANLIYDPKVILLTEDHLVVRLRSKWEYGFVRSSP